MSELNRKELKQRISKGLFDNIYLIYGEEKMYVKLDTDALVTKLMGKNPSEFNFHSFSAPCSLDEIAVAIQVLPFMSERNCVRVNDLDFNDLQKGELDQLLAIIKNVPDTTVLIFSMPTLEQEMKNLGAQFKKVKTAVEKNGVSCAEAKESDISLARQIVRWADKRSIKIEQPDAYRLQEYVGDDLNTIKNELDKLCNFVGDGGTITSEDIELLVSKRLEADIFKLSDAIIEGKSDLAYSMLDALFYQKVKADNILTIISYAYIDFYRAKVAQESGLMPNDVAQEFGYGRRAFVLKNAFAKVRRIPCSALRDSLSAIVDTMGSLHSATLNSRMVLEELVAKLLLYSAVRE